MQIDESPIEALRLWGASAAAIAEWSKVLHAEAQREQEPEVWPEHWHAAQLFAALGSQWRCAQGMGGSVWLGLDYAAIVPPVLQAVRTAVPRRRRQRWPVLFDQLQVMEGAAIAARNR